MVVPTYNPTPRKQRQEDGCKFETSLFYIVSLDLKEKGMAPMPPEVSVAASFEVPVWALKSPLHLSCAGRCTPSPPTHTLRAISLFCQHFLWAHLGHSCTTENPLHFLVLIWPWS